MQKIIHIYTLFYIFLIFCSSLLQSIPGIAVFREGYILFLFLLLFIFFDKLRFNRNLPLILIYIFVNFISFCISPNKADALSSFILYISGPLLFCFITCLPLKKKFLFSLEHSIIKIFIIFILVGIIIYQVQQQFYAMFGIDSKLGNFINLYRISSTGEMKMRLSGLCVHPTTMGSICLFVFLYEYLMFNRKKSVITAIPYYLSNTRSIIMGTPVCWYMFLPPKRKIWITFLIPIFIAIVIMILTKTILDSSLLVHFADLFLNGPELLLKNVNLIGHGHGTMSPFASKASFIHVESDLYIALMQIGILGTALYTFIILRFLRTLKKDNNPSSKFCAFVVVCINIGCIFLSYYCIRILSNFMWLELALYFSKRRYICQK